MSRSLVALLALIAAVCAGAFLMYPQKSAWASVDAPAAPAFTHTRDQDWLNSPPLTWAALRGKVVLIDVWTFDCWNCYRSIPWLHDVERQFAGAGLQIVGVHTPELPQEYVLANVKAKLVEFQITHPVMLDNDYSYWTALGNHYWPAFYLVDRQGRLRGKVFGETHAGDRNATAVEEQIAALLAEAP